ADVANAAGTGTGTSVNVNSTTSQMIFELSSARNLGSWNSPQAGQTQTWASSTNNNSAGSYKNGTGSSASVGWGISQSQAWAEIAVPINAATSHVLNNFPVLINLSSDTDLKNHALSNGNDIL